MRAIRCAWVGLLVVPVACGGNSFTAAAGSGSDGGSEGGGSEGGPDMGAGSVHCGPATCSGVTPVCCAASSFTCAHVQCGCTTQLECSSNADCSSLAPVCCVNRRAADLTCASNHFVARCAVACTNGALEMCDPNSRTDTCVNAQCSSDSGDLANVGLPANGGYGVCK
jgi:hypothetical protein